MKILIAIFATTILSIITFSCSKDDTPAPAPVAPILAPLQDPLQGYLTASGFIQKKDVLVNRSDFEFGYSFIPLVNGKMTAIIVSLPDSRSGLRVTIWNKATATAIRTENIDVPVANVDLIKQITALDLVKDKEYFLTINSNDWYERKKTDVTDVVYPFTVGDIKITASGYTVGTSQTMPTIFPVNFYSGDCSFKFQK